MAENTSGFSLRNVFLANLTTKLMALAIAVALWLYAYNQSVVRDTVYMVPVRVIAPEGWEAVDTEGRRVKVTPDFPRRFEDEMDRAYQNREIYVEVQPTPERGANLEEPQVVTLKQRNLVTGRDYGIQSVRFDPPSLAIRLVRQAEVELPVRLKLSDPPAGYEVDGRPDITPAKIKVVGRKDILSAVTEIVTAEVDISTKHPVTHGGGTYEGQIAIEPKVALDGKESSVSFPSGSLVNYVVRLVRKSKTQTFTGVPINLSAPFGFAYTAEISGGEAKKQAAVEVTGPEEIVTALTPNKIMLYVRLDVDAKPTEAPKVLTVYADFIDVTGKGALDFKVVPPVVDVQIKPKEAR